MYHVVPKGRSIVKSEGKFEELIDAQRLALKLKNQTNADFDVMYVKHTRLWSTDEYQPEKRP